MRGGIRSYQIAVVALEDGERAAHSGYLQLAGNNNLSGDCGDEEAIKLATLNSFPGAIEYLPMRIPNRQYRKMEREQAIRALTEKALAAFMVVEELQNKEPYELAKAG